MNRVYVYLQNVVPSCPQPLLSSTFMARLLVVPDTKTAFRSAISAHEPTETQFREVARILANASNVGMSHQLWRDWASIRQVCSSY